MKNYYLVVIYLLLLTACATQKVKYDVGHSLSVDKPISEVAHTVYLIGDAGLSPQSGMNKALQLFKAKLDVANQNSTAIFLGDNIYPAGLPRKKDKPSAYKNATHQLDAQLATLENFKGRALFIPGNHDWYSNGLEGLARQEKYINKKLKQKKPFLPENGCPLTQLKINDQLTIIVVDTEWYLTNWDKHPTMNDNCEIKSRAKFWIELEGMIKKNSDKTTIIAMHHPMFTYGSHGGQFSMKQQLFQGQSKFPLPVISSFINLLRKTSGASPADVQNKRYSEFKNRMVTLAQYSKKVIFASGHEHTLQFIKEQNTPQIVSGSGAKKGAARLLNGSKFATGEMGYAELKIFYDGSSEVIFKGLEPDNSEHTLFKTQVLAADSIPYKTEFSESFPSKATASIYSKEEIDKTGFFRTLWGERYQKYYGPEVSAKTVDLDTLYGGLQPVRKGGGHQSKSLRLRTKGGKEYVMRALRKVSELYLQSMVFQEQYVMDDLQESFLQKFLLDFYTGSHPYAPFTIGPLSDAIGIYHTNPVLYYIPKQDALAEFNQDYGDELYMIEEHAGDGHGDKASYGFSNKLISTDDMLDNLRDNEKYAVDDSMYVRARLFDMIIGDWDRHVDQWRWAEFKEKGAKKTVYKPVPRDRDQAFSIMGDGLFMSLATRMLPPLRLMEGFNEEIRNVKGFNSSPKTYVLDLALLSETEQQTWIKEAKFIKEHLTAAAIDKAFRYFPPEVHDETVSEIKRILLKRISDVEETANTYYGVLNKYAVVTGTDKDDWFEIEFLNNDEVKVSAYRKINGKKKRRFFQRTFASDVTKEIWVYGLDDEDRFDVTGAYKSKIKLRLVGGQNNDVYHIKEGGSTFVYDYKSKKNRFENVSKAKVRLTDNYAVNTYQPLKIRASLNQLLPLIGFNPDDGLKLGITNTYTYNGFRQNPFSQQHALNAAFYFATSGFELGYKGEFANALGKANFEIDTKLTSPNFAINFFGLGNETENFDDALGLDYNRVRYSMFKIAPSLVWRGQLGSKVRTGVSYESISVEETENRFINMFYQENGEETLKKFLGVDWEYAYENTDNEAFPTLGMTTTLQMGYKTEISDGSGSFGYIIPSLSLDYKLIPSGNLVLATKWKAHFTIGDGYEFYQGASIGGIDGLRGFRNQRFTAKKAYYQNTDIRLNLGKRKTGILPTTIGIYGGFDYGRVWQANDISNRWHSSYGGGFFLNAAGVLSIRAALFNSLEGPRFSFGLGFGF